MRITHVIGSLLAPLGGAEQYVRELARGQAETGHEVRVVTGWVSPDVRADLEAHGVAVTVVRVRRPYPPDRRGSRPAAVLFHALDLLDSIRTPRALRAALLAPHPGPHSRSRPGSRIMSSRGHALGRTRGSGASAQTPDPRTEVDVVHAHRVAGLGAGFLRSVPAPVVLTVHDYSLVDTRSSLLRGGVVAPRAPWLQRQRTRVMSRAVRGTTMIFPNDGLRERHREWGLEIPVGSRVVPHGWRLAGRAAPQARVETNASTVFLFLGKYLPTKGADLLLEAWGDGIPGAELWFAGAGPLEPEVAAAAAAGRIRDLGWLDPAARDAALAAADVLVLPSTGPEIFLLAAAEGALAGIPVVSTTAATPPAVRDGESGVLVKPHPAAIRAAMERLQDPGVRAVLSAGARAFGAELDFATHLERLLDVYAAAGAPAAPVREPAR